MNISPALQKTFNRSVLQLQKYSPQILTAVGIAGLVTAGVLAAKNTLKLDETLTEAKIRLEAVKDHPEATQGDVNKAVTRNIFELTKLYAAPVTLGTASIVSILVGHRILHQRNLAVIAAYKGLEQAFSEYRKRVIEEHGAEADEKYRYGIRDVVEEVDGKKVKSQTVDPIGGDDYIFSFDVGNENWDGKSEHNLFFLNRHQMVLNDRLKARGHVFLNDVLRALGFEDTAAGAVTGWMFEEGTGDDFISFGIKDLQATHDQILLNFNVDGIILDHVEKKRKLGITR